MTGAIVGSRVVVCPELPAPSRQPMPAPAEPLAGKFTVADLPDGRCELRDLDGRGWGIFANRGLAERTAGLFQ